MYMRVCAVRQCFFRTILVAGALEAFLKLQAVRLDTVVPVCLVHERHQEGVPDLSPQHRPWVQDSKHTHRSYTLTRREREESQGELERQTARYMERGQER